MITAQEMKDEVRQNRIITIHDAINDIEYVIKRRSAKSLDYTEPIDFVGYELYEEDINLIISLFKDNGFGIETDEGGRITISWEDDRPITKNDILEGD